MTDLNNQQYDLYHAEEPVFVTTEVVTDPQAWINRLIDRVEWRTQFPQITAVAYAPRQPGEGSVGGWQGDLGCIEMDADHNTELHYAHELAHVTSSKGEFD